MTQFFLYFDTKGLQLWKNLPSERTKLYHAGKELHRDSWPRKSEAGLSGYDHTPYIIFY